MEGAALFSDADQTGPVTEAYFGAGRVRFAGGEGGSGVPPRRSSPGLRPTPSPEAAGAAAEADEGPGP